MYFKISVETKKGNFVTNDNGYEDDEIVNTHNINDENWRYAAVTKYLPH